VIPFAARRRRFSIYWRVVQHGIEARRVMFD
jgi:hypothetical protein